LNRKTAVVRERFASDYGEPKRQAPGFAALAPGANSGWRLDIMSDTLLVAASGNPALANSIANHLHLEPCRIIHERYPGGELHVEFEATIAGSDLFIVQPTEGPIERNVFEILLLVDAARRAGASRCFGIVPYFGYGRQDRRSGRRVPVGARVAAQVLDGCGLDRLVFVDLHDPATEGFFATPVVHLSAVPLLIEALGTVRADSIIVSPDLGAVSLARRVSAALSLPMAVTHKLRLSGERVEAQGMTGDVRGLHPIIVDDMVTTGGTVEAAIQQLLRGGVQHPVTVAVSHGVFEPHSIQRLETAGVSRLVVTDSVSLPSPLPDWVSVVGIGELLAEAIRRLHNGHPLDELLSRA
jgi:ribose-phosphate pyrophosphokinase